MTIANEPDLHVVRALIAPNPQGSRPRHLFGQEQVEAGEEIEKLRGLDAGHEAVELFARHPDRFDPIDARRGGGDQVEGELPELPGAGLVSRTWGCQRRCDPGAPSSSMNSM